MNDWEAVAEKTKVERLFEQALNDALEVGGGKRDPAELKTSVDAMLEELAALTREQAEDEEWTCPSASCWDGPKGKEFDWCGRYKTKAELDAAIEAAAREQEPVALRRAAEIWERLKLPGFLVDGHLDGQFKQYTVPEVLRTAATRLAP